jgi:hypothetical protein
VIKLRPIPPLKRRVVSIPELPSWHQIEKPLDIQVSVFDRAYLWMNETITYSKWALRLIRFTIALIIFIQSLKKEKKDVQ